MALPNANQNLPGSGSGHSIAAGGIVTMGGGWAFHSDATLTPGDGNNGTANEGTQLVEANTNDSAATITLGDDIAAIDGYIVIVKDIGGNAGTNNITITAETDGSHDIDGSNQDLTISSNFGATRLYADGTDFWTW